MCAKKENIWNVVNLRLMGIGDESEGKRPKSGKTVVGKFSGVRVESFFDQTRWPTRTTAPEILLPILCSGTVSV